MRCHVCGAAVHPSSGSPLCPACSAVAGARLPAPTPRPTASVPPRTASPLWLWTTPEARAALATRDLAVILRAYRAATRVSQRALAAGLGYDPTYISMIETGRREITDLESRRRIARYLCLPAHVLGVADEEEADFTAMLQFGESTVRLALLARHAGRSADAINELWPLVVRLEARVSDGSAGRDLLLLLGHARAVLGVALGDVLPEERLVTAARCTGRALRVAERLGEPVLMAYAMRVHGNELRKAGRPAAAVTRLQRAATLTPPPERGAALIQLARAAAGLGNVELFDHAVMEAGRLVDHAAPTPLVNLFVVDEVRLRGLVDLGRRDQARAVLERTERAPASAAPQWRVIQRVTLGQALLTVGDTAGAAEVLHDAVTAAAAHRLPHQIQRVVRSAGDRLAEVTRTGGRALHQLRRALPVA